MALEPNLLTETVAQIGSWAWKQGFRKLFIVNGHVTNFAPLRCALELLRSRNDGMMFALLNSARLSGEIEDCFTDDAVDWHANRAETSVMMHKCPAMVRDERRKDGDDPDRTTGLVFSHPVNRTSLNGVTGQPSASTEQEGLDLWTLMCNTLVDIVERGLQEEAPLNQPYHPQSK